MSPEVSAGVPADRIPPLARERLLGDAPDVAPRLLNTLLVAGGVTGRIVEVEAYTSDDPASHSARGVTSRNRSMFARAGTLYVYLSYGIHHCANVVTGSPGDGQAVLIRSVEVWSGLETVRRRRGPRPEGQLTNGPGKVCQAFGIAARDDGVDLLDAASPIRLLDDGTPPPVAPGCGTRIGISRGVDRPWRWWVPQGAAPG